MKKTPAQFMVAALIAANLAFLPTSQAEAVPQTVAELWADFDPRRDPLETEVIREWKEDGSVFRIVRYLVGSF